MRRFAMMIALLGLVSGAAAQDDIQTVLDIMGVKVRPAPLTPTMAREIEARNKRSLSSVNPIGEVSSSQVLESRGIVVPLSEQQRELNGGSGSGSGSGAGAVVQSDRVDSVQTNGSGGPLLNSTDIQIYDPVPVRFEQVPVIEPYQAPTNVSNTNTNTDTVTQQVYQASSTTATSRNDNDQQYTYPNSGSAAKPSNQSSPSSEKQTESYSDSSSFYYTTATKSTKPKLLAVSPQPSSPVCLAPKVQQNSYQPKQPQPQDWKDSQTIPTKSTVTVAAKSGTYGSPSKVIPSKKTRYQPKKQRKKLDFRDHHLKNGNKPKPLFNAIFDGSKKKKKRGIFKR